MKLPSFFWCTVANVQTVLVVDDDELLARMISEFLVGKGFHVWTARDGLQGYSSYRRCQTEMVVTDIEMPHLDGFDMMRCIRTINPSVKTIYMSAAPTQYRGALIMEAQKFAAATLRKPFVGMELLNILLSASDKVTPVLPRYELSGDEKKLVWKEAG